jgi:K+-sensing histidine kinase KdpD
MESEQKQLRSISWMPPDPKTIHPQTTNSYYKHRSVSEPTISRLLSLLSHELRGPVGVIRGYLRILDVASLSSQQQMAVSAALRASERAVQLLDQASLLAQLKRGDIDLERKAVPIASVLHAAVQAVELPEDSAVTLSVARGPAITVMGDANQLRVALVSLITAVARTQTSRVTVEIAAEHAKLGRTKAVRLRIGPQTVSRVTGKESAPNLMRGGLGLQLPIALAIIEGHDGELREVRQSETNTSLIVLLPAAPAQAGARGGARQ